MFQKKKYIKLEPLILPPPQQADLQRALVQAQKFRGSTVELPWRLKENNLYFSLAVRSELSSVEHVWTLYQGEGSNSHVMWSAPFTDLDLLKEVIALTMSESIGSTDSVSVTKSHSLPPDQQMVTETTAPLQPAVPAQPDTPVQPHMVVADQSQLPPVLPALNPELFKKHKNFLLGQFLIATGLIVSATLDKILKLQEMIATGLIDTEQAIEAIKKANLQGSDINIVGSQKKANISQHTPLLGEILVRAEVINSSILLAILKLQELVRSGAMTPGEACQSLRKELTSGSSLREKGLVSQSRQEEVMLELLLRAGLIAQEDKKTVHDVQKKHGGKVGDILMAAGKVNQNTIAAAHQCEYLLSEKRIKLEQVMIALNYCERSRVGLAEAIVDLGWHDDLDL